MIELGGGGQGVSGNALMLVNEHDLRQVVAKHGQILTSEALARHLGEMGGSPIKMTPEQTLGLLNSGHVLRSEGFSDALRRVDLALQASKSVSDSVLERVGRSNGGDHSSIAGEFEVVMQFTEDEDGDFVLTW
ncbi:TPA: hypothetical protein I8273_004594 [Aeromonas hydrophila]|nr:hypothetical protein [Aeromonas hydrophila]HAT2639056.1 hypothetical protein [Aeromonas hydrophila]HAT3424309.1 hypothetical protein [Aeromonas hydrophila]HAT3534287.1 hypothetical protein [Aeromonas hydrophila]